MPTHPSPHLPPQVYKEKFENLRRSPHKTQVTPQSTSEPCLNPHYPPSFTLSLRLEVGNRGEDSDMRFGSMFCSLLDFFFFCHVKKTKTRKTNVSVGVSKSPWGQTSYVLAAV